MSGRCARPGFLAFGQTGTLLPIGHVLVHCSLERDRDRPERGGSVRGAPEREACPPLCDSVIPLERPVGGGGVGTLHVLDGLESEPVRVIG
jgi:hypothetical protein